MKNCPTCDGEGTQTVCARTLTDDGWEENPPVEIDCTDCDGTGEISEQEAEFIERRKGIYCNCDDPGDDVTHFPDGVAQTYNGLTVNKHHWRCNDCGLVRQMG